MFFYAALSLRLPAPRVMVQSVQGFTTIVRPFSPANDASSTVQSPEAMQHDPSDDTLPTDERPSQKKNMPYPITHPLNKNNKCCPNCKKFFRGRNHMLNHVLNKARCLEAMDKEIIDAYKNELVRSREKRLLKNKRRRHRKRGLFVPDVNDSGADNFYL